ncbi:hypothetical protein [Sphingomonas fuzhouensis]|uniref:hypothetical protein n=1 Tax=Sphingomonas fuzhouensis TaxID=3106033 RepID=UPI002AFECD0E|nr:hypothetical protein [Sphingomonas sp. SGZ-02]
MHIKTLEAVAIAAALTPARLAGLRFPVDPDAGSIPATRLRHYVHASAASLLVVPAIVPPAPRDVAGLVRAYDTDVLIALASRDSIDDITFAVMLAGNDPVYSSGLNLFLGSGASCHFVPPEPGSTCFALLPVGLRGCECAPWDSEVDWRAGLADGRALLSGIFAGGTK